MSETLEYLQLFARCPVALRRFLSHTVTLDEARRAVRDRMQTRDARFLQIVERGIGYGCANPADETDVHLQSDAIVLFTIGVAGGRGDSGHAAGADSDGDGQGAAAPHASPVR